MNDEDKMPEEEENFPPLDEFPEEGESEITVEPEKGSEGSLPEDSEEEEIPPSEKKSFFSSGFFKFLLLLFALLFSYWFWFSNDSPEFIHKNRYTIALDPSWHPLPIRRKTENMTIFSKLLLQKIAEEEHLHFQIIQNSSARLFPDLEMGKYEGVISALRPSHQTRNDFLVSDPIYNIGSLLLVQANSSYTTLRDLGGKVIALAGDARSEVNLDEYPTVIFTSYRSPLQALADLDNNVIDGVILNSLEAQAYAKGLYAGRFKIAGSIIHGEGIALILHKSKEAEKVMEHFNQGLEKIRQESSFKQLLKTWQLLPD